MTPKLQVLRGLMLSGVLASGAVMMVLLQASKIILDWGSLLPPAGSLALLVFAAIVCRMRGFEKSSLIMEVLAGGIAFSILVLLSTYLVISLNAPTADSSLIALDQWMGFDGVAFIRLVDSMPWLSWMLMHAYASFAFQLLVLPILLILFGQPSRAFGLVLAYAVVGFVASVVSIWFPALGAHVVYDIDPSSLSSINPHFGYAFLPEFNAVREQSEFVFSLDAAQGILTFPSVHAAVAVICALCAFGVPLLRYPFLVLNVLMAVSTLTHGSHYLVDTLVGMAVAAFALYTVSVASRISAYQGLAWARGGAERRA